MRFFLGYGERLTERVAPPGGGGGAGPAYSFDEAVRRLRPMVRATAHDLQNLPQAACPRNEAVGVVTLHPQWMAKSYHPQQLLDEYQLRQVGSRPVDIQPERWTRRTEPEPTTSTELYLAGKRESFAEWANELDVPPYHITDQIRRLETVRAPAPRERIRGISSQTALGTNAILLEVVLHASDDLSDQYILAGFDAYARSLEASIDLDRRFHVGGLCFIP